MWLRRSRGGREEAPDAGRTNKGERVESRCALFLVTPSSLPLHPCILFFFRPQTLHRHGRRCFRLDRKVRSGEAGAPRWVDIPLSHRPRAPLAGCLPFCRSAVHGFSTGDTTACRPCILEDYSLNPYMQLTVLYNHRRGRSWKVVYCAAIRTYTPWLSLVLLSL